MTEIMPFPENKCETDLLDRPIPGILVFPGFIHRKGAMDGNHVRAQGHQDDEELAVPEFVNAQLSGSHGFGQVRHRVVPILVTHNGQLRSGGNAEDFVAKQGDRPFRGEQQSDHPLMGLHPEPGQVVKGGGGGDQDLLQSRLPHPGSNPENALVVHMDYDLSIFR